MPSFATLSKKSRAPIDTTTLSLLQYAKHLGEAAAACDSNTLSKILTKVTSGGSCGDLTMSRGNVRAYQIVESFVSSLQKTRVIARMGLTLDEDTVVHQLLHSLFSQVFDDEQTQTLWANGESLASRAQKARIHPERVGKKAGLQGGVKHGRASFCGTEIDEVCGDFATSER
ncbi:hypothetical protein HDU87_000716 [Geranomyces variabilis]|uniref:Uncharacterized protein n=1 Tax=Geranomyces variabilis TaxID=109894 RepID=A0AAD5TN37_9FUNG|nr:hypothetical protein HDU87_000716 [Geranomyces variabilis]